MPIITIHIDTEDLTPDELERLHRDITRIKLLITEIVGRGLGAPTSLQLPITSVVRGLRASTSLQLPINSIGQGFRALPTTQSPQTLLEKQTTALQHQTTILEQQIPVLETIKHLRRSVALLPQPNVSLHQLQTQHITPLVTEDTQHQTTRHRTDFTRVQQSIIDTVADVPSNLLNATYNALITIPTQTRETLMQLKIETEQDIAEVNDSAVLSAQEKADRIEQIERTAAQRRKQIESDANRAKIASFNKVVANFVRGIGRMIAEQVKLRIARQILGAQQAVVPFLAGSPVLSIGAAALFSASFDDPINDALAQQAGIRQAQERATKLGRRSAIDLKQNFEMGFVKETERQIESPQRVENPPPVVKNEIKLVIGGQELKAIYEETQRQIAQGVISG